jgi:hypothetical protein
VTTYASDGFLPSTSEYTKRKANIKVATPDIILEENTIASETITQAFFAEMGGVEILSAARSITIDSPLQQGSSLILDSGNQLVINSGYEMKSAEDRDSNFLVSNYFPLDSSNLASYVNSIEVDIDSSAVSGVDPKVTLPGYIEIYLNNFPPGYQIQVEMLSDVYGEDAIIYKGAG